MAVNYYSYPLNIVDYQSVILKEKKARHLLASPRELKVRKLVVTRDTERGAL